MSVAAKSAAAPVLYVSDFGASGSFDPADLFDLASLLRSPNHDLRGVCLPASSPANPLTHLFALQSGDVPLHAGASGLRDALRDAPTGVNVILVGGYSMVADVLVTDRALIREKGARLFLIGGHANDYRQGRAGERLPLDPRLLQRHPERFAPTGDPRVPGGVERTSWASLLTSGEGVIWLPRDLCLWRYAASGMLENGGPVCDLLLSTLAETNGGDAEAPVLLSTFPALLLAVRPDPFAWMRLFRVVAARVETNEETQMVSSFVTKTDTPNLYAVIAIDSAALSKLFTARLRDTPLTSYRTL